MVKGCIVMMLMAGVVSVVSFFLVPWYLELEGWRGGLAALAVPAAIMLSAALINTLLPRFRFLREIWEETNAELRGRKF